MIGRSGFQPSGHSGYRPEPASRLGHSESVLNADIANYLERDHLFDELCNASIAGDCAAFDKAMTRFRALSPENER